MSLTQEDVHAADDRCPRWCTLDHSGSDVMLLHESETRSIEVSHPYDAKVAESLDVRVVHYVADEAEHGDSGGHQFIELAYHVDTRYRVINLAPHEAVRLAELLITSAGQTGG